jgi:hypothetical protein
MASSAQALGSSSGRDTEHAEDLHVFSQSYQTNALEIFEVFTAVTMRNGVFWGVIPFGSCKNRRFGGI